MALSRHKFMPNKSTDKAAKKTKTAASGEKQKYYSTFYLPKYGKTYTAASLADAVAMAEAEAGKDK